MNTHTDTDTDTQTVTEATGIGPCSICSDILNHGEVATWTVGGWAHEDCADSPLAAPVNSTKPVPVVDSTGQCTPLEVIESHHVALSPEALAALRELATPSSSALNMLNALVPGGDGANTLRARAASNSHQSGDDEQ